MKVLVKGLGNIGTTLANILIDLKDYLNISEVYAVKHYPNNFKEDELILLQAKGIKVCVSDPYKDYLLLENIINNIDFIFDCTINGNALKTKEYYKTLPNLKGVVAQGSEKGFGKSFMFGLKADFIKNEKYVHIVSCNTHGSASILQALGGPNLDNIESADFVVVRRSEDLSNHERLVTSNVVARHLDPIIGTHHAIDVHDMYHEALNIKLDISSSDITTPSQLMHSARFNILLKNKTDIIEAFKQHSTILLTNKFDSNTIFELGRRYGIQGRLYYHSIVIANNLLINNNRIQGWCFVPQEGNTIFSTLVSYVFQTNQDINIHLIWKNLVINV